MKRWIILSALATLGVTSAHAQLAYGLGLSITSGTAGGTYNGTSTGYFWVGADVEGPGTFSSSASAQGQYYLGVAWNSSSTPNTKVSYVYNMTDEAIIYYYLRGSNGAQTSGSVTQYSLAKNKVQTVTEPSLKINQAQTTQTNTLQAGPTTSTNQSGYYFPVWVYNSSSGTWSGSTGNLITSQTSASASLVAPTYAGDSKENESYGYAEDTLTLVSVTSTP